MSDDTPDIMRKDIDGEPKVNRRQRLVLGYISTTDVDMDGDVVLPGGMKTTRYFDSTRSVTLYHKKDMDIGTNRNLDRQTGGIFATTYIGKHALGEDAMTMIEDQVLRGFSIEWDPRTQVYRKPTPSEKEMYGHNCKNVLAEWELIRYTITARPCNPFAVVNGIKSMDGAMEETWTRMEKLFVSGKIHRSSAVAFGFPDTAERKSFDTGRRRVRRAEVIDGAVYVR